MAHSCPSYLSLPKATVYPSGRDDWNLHYLSQVLLLMISGLSGDPLEAVWVRTSRKPGLLNSSVEARHQQVLVNMLVLAYQAIFFFFVVWVFSSSIKIYLVSTHQYNTAISVSESLRSMDKERSFKGEFPVREWSSAGKKRGWGSVLEKVPINSWLLPRWVPHRGTATL